MDLQVGQWEPLGCKRSSAKHLRGKEVIKNNFEEEQRRGKTQLCIPIAVTTDSCILPTQCICVFRMVLTINS
jgi:hypothetical protein